MSVGAALRVAFAALLVHKGRSALTCLGIIIGIGAVIALVAAGDGAREELDDRLRSIGTNLILIRAGARSQHFVSRLGRSPDGRSVAVLPEKDSR